MQKIRDAENQGCRKSGMQKIKDAERNTGS
jgi:hypothetical protein